MGDGETKTLLPTVIVPPCDRTNGNDQTSENTVFARGASHGALPDTLSHAEIALASHAQ